MFPAVIFPSCVDCKDRFRPVSTKQSHRSSLSCDHLVSRNVGGSVRGGVAAGVSGGAAVYVM